MESKTENSSRSPSSSDPGEAARRLLKVYYQRLSELGIETIERGTRLQHAKWMCLRAEGHEDVEKLNRWLGWIQCTMDYEGIYGLNESIEMTRKEMGDA